LYQPERYQRLAVLCHLGGQLQLSGGLERYVVALDCNARKEKAPAWLRL